MKRTIACRLSGSDVVQTTTILNDDGSLHREQTITLGDRDTVLAQMDEQLAEAKRDRDGATAASTTKPAAGDGAPGDTVEFYLDGTTLNKVETKRDAKGKLRSQRIEPLGNKSNQLAHLEERFQEIKTVRDAVAGAQ